MKYLKTIALTLGALLISCRGENSIVGSTTTTPTTGEEGEIKGFFLLNEGNMGSNKATLDYFDYESGEYTKNIYGERNPGVVNELGDVGNDLGIYGDKLYAVINCSHLIEVMNKETVEHITQISIPNCRYIKFHEGYAYVSSYAGPVEVDPNARLGYVAKIDTLTFQVVDTCVVGYQPEEMVITDGKLFVANSGGYLVPDYDTTVSVIDLSTFKEIEKIEVAINLHRMELDSYGNIWVSSRGDYYDIPSKTYVINSESHEVTDEFDLLACSDMTIVGDSLYVYGTEWNYTTQTTTKTFAIVNTETKRILTRSFVIDGTDDDITLPYGIAVNPNTRDFYLTDAKDYVTPGKVHCYSSSGVHKWEATTGDIPSAIVFTDTKLSSLEK